MTEVIVSLALVLGLSGLLGIVLSRIGQPALVGYIMSGFILAYFDLGFSQLGELADPLAELGIILLLFMAGLEIKISDLKKMGSGPFIIGGGQIAFVLGISLLVVWGVLGLGMIASLFVALALTLCSTIVVVTSLSKRKEMEAPHGRVLMVMMILQDVVGILAILFFDPETYSGGQSIYLAIIRVMISLAVTFITLYLVGRFVMAPIFPKIARSFETIFVTGLIWCFAGVLFAYLLNFSIELGAFIAGMSFSDFKYKFEIEDKMKPLRELGLMLFFAFVAVEATINLSIFTQLGFWILLFLVLLSTPLVVMLLSSIQKLPKKTTFLSAIMGTQTSEFSLVLVTLGVSWGIVGNDVLGIVTAVTIISIILSSVMISKADVLYERAKPFLSRLEWRGVVDMKQPLELKGHIVIFGMKDTKAVKLVKQFKDEGAQVVAVDWNKDILDRIETPEVKTIVADAGDPDVWEYTNMNEAKLVISTIDGNQEGELRMISWLKDHKSKAYIITETNDPAEAKELKDHGSDYVSFPDREAWHSLREKVHGVMGKKK